jgi:hypothetical protein
MNITDAQFLFRKNIICKQSSLLGEKEELKKHETLHGGTHLFNCLLVNFSFSS